MPYMYILECADGSVTTLVVRGISNGDCVSIKVVKVPTIPGNGSL